jgi:hypothetical protein
LRFDGTAWSVVEFATENDLSGIWGSSAHRIWGVGDNGILRHLDPGF